jgi:hypothetical protein
MKEDLPPCRPKSTEFLPQELNHILCNRKVAELIERKIR